MPFSKSEPRNLRGAEMKTVLSLIMMLLAVSACSQNIEVVKSGERLEDAPKAAVDPNAKAFTTGRGRGGGEGEREVPPFVKAYFMHMWVEALYSNPQNKNPNPNWESPLIDPEKGRVWCTDCHVSGQVDFARIPKMRVAMVEELENDKHFMVELMKKWVARLNNDEYFAKAKLKKPVTCLTCHATNPALE